MATITFELESMRDLELLQLLALRMGAKVVDRPLPTKRRPSARRIKVPPPYNTQQVQDNIFEFEVIRPEDLPPTGSS